MGAAEALRQVSGSAVPPADRLTFYDRLLAELQAALGEAAFRTLLAQGRALTWEQAIEYALEDKVP